MRRWAERAGLIAMIAGTLTLSLAAPAQAGCIQLWSGPYETVTLCEYHREQLAQSATPDVAVADQCYFYPNGTRQGAGPGWYFIYLVHND